MAASVHTMHTVVRGRAEMKAINLHATVRSAQGRAQFVFFSSDFESILKSINSYSSNYGQ